MKTKVVGQAVIIMTALTVAAINLLQRYQPEALIKKDENGVPVFAIAQGKLGGVSSYGITFNDTAEDGSARITLMIPDSVPAAARKQWVLDNYGLALNELADFEHEVQALFNSLSAKFNAIEAELTVE